MDKRVYLPQLTTKRQQISFMLSKDRFHHSHSDVTETTEKEMPVSVDGIQ